MHPIYLFISLLPLLSIAAEPTTNLYFHRFKVGSLNATVISDGPVIFTENFFLVPDAALVRSYAASFRATFPAIFQQNVLVIDMPSARIMVDSGSVNVPEFPFFAQGGKLLENMKGAGIDPESIDAVMLTHGHVDHVSGIKSLDGGRAFPNAKIYINKAEHEFWTTIPIVNPKPDILPDDLVAAIQDIYLRSIEPYKDRLVLVPERSSPLPGVRFVPTPGHSPGHVAIRFSSGTERLLATGDSWLTKPDHLENPEWAFLTESDSVQAYETRIRLLEGAARRRELLLSYHEAFPGLGYVSVNGAAFSWTPATTSLRGIGLSITIEMRSYEWDCLVLRGSQVLRICDNYASDKDSVSGVTWQEEATRRFT